MTTRTRVGLAAVLLVAICWPVTPAWAQEGDRAIADGVYKGVIGKKSRGVQRTHPLTFEIRGTKVTARYDPFPELEHPWRCRWQGVYDPERGTVSGTAIAESDTGTTQKGTFRGAIEGRQLVGTSEYTEGTNSAGTFPVSASFSRVQFTVDLGEPQEPEATPPPERIALDATIHVNPSSPKPGDQVELWAVVFGPGGKTLSGVHKIWDVGKSAYGNVDPRFTWDGKELLIKLTVVYENNEYKFTETIPAYVEETTTPAGTGTKTPASTETKAPATAPSGGSPWGPAAILGAVVAGAAGVAAIIGGLIALGHRPAAPRPPRAPQPPRPRPPAPRRPPPPPARVPPKPPPPPPRVPPPPEPPTPSDAPPAPPEAPLAPPPPPPAETAAGATETKPPPPPHEAPADAKPPEEPETEEPEDEEPEDEEPEDEEPEDDEPDGEAPEAATPEPGVLQVTWQPPEVPDPQAALGELRERLQSIIEERTIDGYYIRNPNVLRKIWNNTIGWVLTEPVGGYTGGQCEEAAEWGSRWLSGAEVSNIFGPGTTYDTITIKNARLGGEMGTWVNHIANRVILPDGSRYVIDFWEGLSTGQAGPAIVPEAEWIRRWTVRCTVPPIGAVTPFNAPNVGLPIDPVTIVRGDEEDALTEFIERHGRERGIREYLDAKRARATRQRKPGLLAQAELIVRSYQKDPW